MRFSRIRFARCVFFATLFCVGVGGCVVSPGRITQGLPKLTEPLPPDTTVFLARTYGAGGALLHSRNGALVLSAFRNAFRRRGIDVKLSDSAIVSPNDALKAAEDAKCDVVVYTTVQSWEYNDAGWSGGEGGRDTAVIGVILMNAENKTVIMRATVEVSNGFGTSTAGGEDNPENAVAPIVEKFVNSLFSPEKH